MVTPLILAAFMGGTFPSSPSFKARLFEETAWKALPAYATSDSARTLLFLSLYHLNAWDHLHRLLSLSPPRTLLDSVLWMETQAHRDSLFTLIPLMEALEKNHPELGAWIRYRRAQAHLEKNDQDQVETLYSTLLPPFRSRFLRIWADTLIAHEDTFRLHRILPELQKISPLRARYVRGLLSSRHRNQIWRKLLLDHPGHPLSRIIARRIPLGREERAVLAMSRGQYREVLHWTRSLRTTRLWWYRLDALYKLRRYRDQLNLYHRYPALFYRNPDARWLFRNLVAAYRLKDPRDFHAFLLRVLSRGTRRQQEEAAHLLGEWLLQLDTPLYRRERAWVGRQITGRDWIPDVPFWAGLALITRGDTTMGLRWLRLAWMRSEPGFLQDQVRYWIARVEGTSLDVERPFSFYRWIQPVAYRFSPAPPLTETDPEGEIHDLLRWSVRLHLPWLRALLSSETLLPEDRIRLAQEARDWGWDDLPLFLLRPLSHDPEWADRLWALLYPTPYGMYVCQASQNTEVPISLLYALMREESHFQPGAVSPVGARGLLQLMPGTAKRYGVQNPDALFRPSVNIRVAARLLADLSDSLPHRFAVVAAYNAGKKAVRRWLAYPVQDSVLWVEWIGYRETRNYVRRVIRSERIYRHLLSPSFCEDQDAP